MTRRNLMKSVGIFTRNHGQTVLLMLVVLFLAGFIFAPRRTSANTYPVSLNENIPVEARTMRVASTNAVPGGQVSVSVELDSQGDEAAASFTLNFDPAILSSPVVTIGSGAPVDTSISLNSNQTASGKLGVLVVSGSSYTSSPARQVLAVTFTVAAAAPAGPTIISFATLPTPLSVSNPLGDLLPTVYEFGTVTVSAPAPTFVTVGGRVTTPDGQNLRNAVVALISSSNVRRTATTSSFGLYSFDNVETGGTYTLTVASKRYRFSPRAVAVTTSMANLDFVGLE